MAKIYNNRKQSYQSNYIKSDLQSLSNLFQNPCQNTTPLEKNKINKFLERNQQFSQKKIEKLNKQKLDKLEKEEKELKFTPKISKSHTTRYLQNKILTPYKNMNRNSKNCQQTVLKKFQIDNDNSEKSSNTKAQENKNLNDNLEQILVNCEQKQMTFKNQSCISSKRQKSNSIDQQLFGEVDSLFYSIGKVCRTHEKWKKNIDDKIFNKKLDEIAEEQRKFSFTPQISNHAQKLARESNQPIEERLIYLGKQQKERIRNLSLQNEPSFSFTQLPKTLKIWQKQCQNARN